MECLRRKKMAGKFDTKTLKDLQALNDFLKSRSYVEGTKPTAEDLALFQKFAFSPDFTHVVRWYNHIASFSEAERKAWGGKAAPAAAAAPAKEAAAADDDDELDLFGEETEEEKAALAAKKAADAKKTDEKKPSNRSQIIFNVKVWEAGFPMKKLEDAVRSIGMDGLVWADKAKYVDVAYGVKMLQIGCTIVDALIAVDDLEEKMMALGVGEDPEDPETGYVQSIDQAAFVKL